jgi:plasmid maintenance system antidote protein VapI
MYQFKKEHLKEVKSEHKLIYLAKKIGITRVYLSYILNNKMNCSKAVAYTITKRIDETKEIDYYFKKLS